MSVLAAFDLSGKVAVVTGGNTGLGEAFCKALADVGAHVAIAARTRERSEEVARAIAAAGGRAMVVDVDVTQPTQVESMVASSTTPACATTGRPPRCRARNGWRSLT